MLDQKIDSAPRMMYISFRYEANDLLAYPSKEKWS